MAHSPLEAHYPVKKKGDQTSVAYFLRLYVVVSFGPRP
jgi:hypothetical protein